MYINTPELYARSGTHWWKITQNEIVQMDLVHDPTKLSKSGLKTVERWLQNGYSDSPNGSLAAVWKILMWSVGPRYLLAFDRRELGFEIFSENGAPLVPDVRTPIDPLLRLAIAGRVQAPTIGTVLETYVRAPIYITPDKRQRLTCLSSAPVFGQNFGDKPAPLMKAIVRELGHPLDGDRLSRAMSRLHVGYSLRLQSVNKDNLQFHILTEVPDDAD